METNKGMHIEREFDDLPFKIRREMVVQQMLQGNEANSNVFRYELYANKDQGGFDWGNSGIEEGAWLSSISYGDDDDLLRAIEARYRRDTLTGTETVDSDLLREQEKKFIHESYASLPDWIKEEILRAQKVQTGARNPQVFRESTKSVDYRRGVLWGKTYHGWYAWHYALDMGLYAPLLIATAEAHARYKPKGNRKQAPSGFNFAAFDRLPSLIKREMLVQQKLQGNPPNSSVFKERLGAGKRTGGFDWGDSEQGGRAWSWALTNSKFDELLELIDKKYKKKELGSITDAGHADKESVEEVSKEKEKQDASSNRYDSLPPIVQNEMLVEQELQGNPRNPNVFRTRIAAGKDHGGFDWDKSALGGEAWASALIDGKVNKIKELIRVKYEKEEEPIKSEFDELPEFVVSEMLSEQLRQTGKMDVNVFKENIRTSKMFGGFDWIQSEFGDEVWVPALGRRAGTKKDFEPLKQAIKKRNLQAIEKEDTKPKSVEMIRRFPSGAVRSDDAGKPRFDYISPYSLEAIAEYFTNSSGDFGATNYFKGIPVSDIIPSLFRHVNALHKLPEGNEKVKYELQAIASNAIMALHTISLIERGEYKEVYDKTELIDKEGFFKEQGDR